MAVEAKPLAVAEPAATETLRAAEPDALARRRARTALAAVTAVPLLGLLVCVAATRTVTLLPQTVTPAPNWLAGPLHYAGFYLPVAAAIAAVVAMFGAYVLAIRLAEHVSTRAVLIAIVAFNLIVLLGPPLFSTDLFSYQAYARMFAIYHINPYTHGPSTIALDPVYNYIGSKWIYTPSVYGPLFTLASGALAGVSVSVSELAFKLLAVLASFGVLGLIWRAAKLREVNPTTAIALFGLNPLVTLFGVGGGHNDLLMLLFLSAGIYALLARRPAAGGAAIVVAAATKLTGGILLPFALVAGGGADLRRARLRLLAGAAAATIIVAIPSFLVFGGGLLKMAGTLEAVQGSSQWQGIPGTILNVIGNGETHTIAIGLAVALAGVCAWLLWRVWQGRIDWLEAAGWATLAMLLSAGQLLPWYVSWLFPIVAVTPSPRLRRAAIWMTAIGVIFGVVKLLPNGLEF